MPPTGERSVPRMPRGPKTRAAGIADAPGIVSITVAYRPDFGSVHDGLKCVRPEGLCLTPELFSGTCESPHARARSREAARRVGQGRFGPQAHHVRRWLSQRRWACAQSGWSHPTSRVATAPAGSLRICENLRNLWTNPPLRISHTSGWFYPQIAQIFTDSEARPSLVSGRRLRDMEYSSNHRRERRTRFSDVCASEKSVESRRPEIQWSTGLTRRRGGAKGPRRNPDSFSAFLVCSSSCLRAFV